MIQIGARNMQNYPLLAEIGRSGRPALLKRGLSSTLDELLMAAEYILKEGNPNVMLCERGIRTFETAYRFTLDLMAVPVLKELSHLPVIVDPSHAAGRRDLVLPLSLAAAAVGADGIIVEVHPNPDEAVCDGPQALYADSFAEYASRSSAPRHWPERRSAPSDGVRPTPAAAPGRTSDRGAPLKVAVLGVGLIGGSIGLAARARAGAEVCGYDPDPQRARRRSSWGPSTSGAGHRHARSRAPRSCSSPRRWARSRTPSPGARASPAKTAWSATSARPSSAGRRPPRPALLRRTSARGRGDHWRCARARGHVRGSELVPDARPGRTAALLERLLDLIEALRAQPAAIAAAAHDRLMACISHLPHVFANALAEQALAAYEREGSRPIAGPQLARCDPGRRRQHRGLDRHLHGQRPRLIADRRAIELRRWRRSPATRRRSRPGTSARGRREALLGRRGWRRCTSCAPRCPTGPA